MHRFGRLIVIVALVALVVGALAGPAVAKKPPAPVPNGWGPVVSISPIGNPDPTRGDPSQNSVAVNASGIAVAAWDQYGYAQPNGSQSIGVAVESGGKWGSPITISSPAEFAIHPCVAVGGDGTAAVIWTADNGIKRMIEASVLPAGATSWTAPAVLASGPLGGAPDPGVAQIAIDRNGNATAVWSLWNGKNNVVSAADLARASSSWSPPVQLTEPFTDGLTPSLAMNADGTAAVVWALTPYPTYNVPNVIQEVSRPAGATSWTIPVNVSDVLPPLTNYYQNPKVAIDGGGLASVIWYGSGIMGSRQRSDGTWTPQAALFPTNPMWFFTSASIGSDGAGKVVVAATIFDATINVDRSTIWAATGSPGGSWGQAAKIPGADIDPTSARVAMSPDGALTFVGWIANYNGTVQVSRLSAAGWDTTRIGSVTGVASFQQWLSMSAANGYAMATWKTRSGTQTVASAFRG